MTDARAVEPGRLDRAVTAGRARRLQAYAALASVDAWLAATGRDRARRWTKPLLMPVLATGANAGARPALLVAGLGDVALLGDGPGALAAGMAAFAASHLVWIRTLRPGARAGRTRAPELAVVAAAGALGVVLVPRAGRLAVPAAAYAAVLAVMARAAVRTGDPQAAAGGILFLASDALLATAEFAGLELPGHQGWVMLTYTSAQALLATR